MAPPPKRKGVAPAADAADDLEWAAPRAGPCATCFEFECASPAGLRQHWRLAFFVFGGAFVGVVIYVSLNGYEITQQQSQSR